MGGQTKTPQDQTWQLLQQFFDEAYHDKTQYTTDTSKKARIDERANNIEDTLTEKTAQEGDTAMMFAVMQQQHQDQLNQMKESNEQALALAQWTIQGMAAQMMSLVNVVADNKKTAIKREQDDKENRLPNEGR